MSTAHAGTKANVAFSQYAASGAPGATVTLKTLVYSGGVAATGLSVQFAVDSTVAGSATSDASGAALSYTIPASMSVGTHSVTVSFAGDDTHNPATKTTSALTVTVPKANVAFSLYAASGAPGATVTLKTLVYSGGVPVSGLSVQFAVDSTVAGSATSTAGGAALSYTIPASMAPGAHSVTVTFAGDSTHNSATKTLSALTVTVPKANVTFSLYAASGAQGATVTLKTLVISGGAAVSGLSVQFAVDGSTVGSATSTATGAALSYTIPASMTADVHNVTVSFAGDATHNAASRTTAALTVIATKLSITFSQYAATGNPNQTVTLKSLMLSGGKAVTGKTVQFSVDGTSAGTGVSDSNGVTCSYTIPASMAPGTHSVTVSFAGDSVYNSATRTTAALMVSGGGLQPWSPWPMFHQNLRHTGVGVGSGATGALKWSYQTSGPIDSSPAIMASGAVCVGSHDHHLYAFDPANGNLKWSYPTGDSVFSSPAIGADGIIYVGCMDNNGYGIKLDGTLSGVFTTGGALNSSPAIGVDGLVYVGDDNTFFFTIRPDSGTIKWSYETGSSVRSSPAVGSDGTVYVGSNDGYIYALKPTDGSLKWSYLTGGSVFSSPAIGADGTVYVGSFSHYIYAFDPANGSLKWSFKTGDKVYSSPAIGVDGTVYVGSNDDYVYAINPADGSQKWRFKTGGTVFSSPAIGSDGTVYVGSLDHYLYALNPVDGSQKWRYQTGGQVYSSPAIGSDGTVYVGSYDGAVYAIK